MADIAFLIVTAGFFGLAALLIRGCDGIIGPDTTSPSDAPTGEAIVDEADRVDAAR